MVQGIYPSSNTCACSALACSRDKYLPFLFFLLLRATVLPHATFIRTYRALNPKQECACVCLVGQCILSHLCRKDFETLTVWNTNNCTLNTLAIIACAGSYSNDGLAPAPAGRAAGYCERKHEKREKHVKRGKPAIFENFQKKRDVVGKTELHWHCEIHYTPHLPIQRPPCEMRGPPGSSSLYC